MKTLKIQDGDFVTGSDNKWVDIDGLDAIAQRVRHRLKLFAGEWFLDTTEGVDWIGVFEKPFSIRKMKAEIIKALAKDDVVSALDSIDIVPDFKSRSLEIKLSLIADGEKLNISEIMSD